KMHITTNGKIDKRLLPEIDFSEMINTNYEPPRTDIEKKIAEIWEEVLGIEKVGINDNFFEIGGNSLKAILVTTKIGKELKKDISVKSIFENPIIKLLSKYIDESIDTVYSMIEKVEEQEYYKMSSAQKRIYSIQEFEKESIAYNMPFIFKVEGGVNKEKYEQIFEKLIKRHESLRTYFENRDGEFVQKINSNFKFNIRTLEANSLDLKSLIKHFDLNKAPLLRVEIIKVNNEEYLLIDIHHIIADGISIKILITEFIKLYKGEKLEEIEIQYKDYAIWQNNLLDSNKIKKEEMYWLNIFKGDIPVLDLAYDYERPLIQSFNGNNKHFIIDKKLIKRLRGLSRKTKTTMNMVFLAAFNILLSKHSSQNDIIIGMPIAGRRNVEVQNIIGMFVNTLALRNKPSNNKTFIEFLEEVRVNTINAFDNQSYQLDMLIEKLNIVRDIGRNPLFDVVFDYKESSDDINISDLSFKLIQSEGKISKFDISLGVVDCGDTIKLNFEYCTKLFKEETIELFIERYINILDSICSNTEVKISEIDMLSQDEKNKVINCFNETKEDYNKNITIVEAFENQVNTNSNNIAIVYGEEKITYGELNVRANKIASTLIEIGIKKDEIVAIRLERSIEAIVAIIGVLKTGAAYLPIDVEYPEERVKYMLEDSYAKVLITSKKFESDFELKQDKLLIEEYKTSVNHENVNIEITNDSIGYIIYTSGSTGKPKGVLVTHKNVINVCNWFGKRYDVESNKNVLHNTSIAFDVSIEEIFGTLLNAGTIYITSKEESLNREKIRSLIKRNNINIVQLVPVTIQEFMSEGERLESVKVLISGGEALSVKTKNEILNIGYNLYNCYGPTETTVDAITTKCEINNRVIIGKPIGNTKVYILGKDLELKGIGIAGELFIGGDGL
ncbi:AMP-binding protein, partial [Clostridium gasigenes]